MTQHFCLLAANNQLCLHVETFQDAVTQQSVPARLSAAYGNNCVFGWEPPIMRVVGEAIDQILTLASEALTGNPANIQQVQRDVNRFELVIQRIHAAMPAEIPLPRDIRVTNAAATWAPIKTYLDGVYGTGAFLETFTKRNPRNPQTELQHSQSLMQLQNGLMTLRDTMNPVFGANILFRINQFPLHTHLITCGFAHLQNVIPLLQNCININLQVGIVDPNTR